MKHTNHVIKIMLLFAIFIIVFGCNKKEETKPNIKFTKISINGVGDFEFKDSLTYAAVDSSIYKVKIYTEPAVAKIYYKTGSNSFVKLDSGWISIDSTSKRLDFYADLDGYNKTQIKSLDFSFKNDSLLRSFNMYPNPTSGQLKFGFSSKTRGVLKYSIYYVSGLLKITKEETVLTDTCLITTDITQFASGIYLLRLNYGETILTKPLIKQ
jgi:hypothetical protein